MAGPRRRSASTGAHAEGPTRAGGAGVAAVSRTNLQRDGSRSRHSATQTRKPEARMIPAPGLPAWAGGVGLDKVGQCADTLGRMFPLAPVWMRSRTRFLSATAAVGAMIYFSAPVALAVVIVSSETSRHGTVRVELTKRNRLIGLVIGGLGYLMQTLSVWNAVVDVIGVWVAARPHRRGGAPSQRRRLRRVPRTGSVASVRDCGDGGHPRQAGRLAGSHEAARGARAWRRCRRPRLGESGSSSTQTGAPRGLAVRVGGSRRRRLDAPLGTAGA